MDDVISKVELFASYVNYAHGEYVMSGGRTASRQSVTHVRLTTGEGLMGWGEVTPLGATYLPAFTEGIRAAIAFMAPHLLGCDPSNLSAVNRRMDELMFGQNYAKSPIDMACWDLKGQMLGVPVCDLLGGRLQDTYPIYEPVPLRSPEEMGQFIRERRAAGTNRFQLKIGNEPRVDIERCEASVDAAASDTIIDADANGGWDLAAAKIAIAGIRHLPVILEQPCRTTEDSVLATRHCDLPLILDESITTLEDLVEAKLRAGAVAVNVKLSRVGGLTKAALFRDVLQDLAMSVSVEDTWGGDVVTSAVSQVAASTRPASLLMTSPLNELTLDGDVAGHVPCVEFGRASAPTGPGLGITVDSDRLGEPIASWQL